MSEHDENNLKEREKVVNQNELDMEEKIDLEEGENDETVSNEGEGVADEEVEDVDEGDEDEYEDDEEQASNEDGDSSGLSDEEKTYLQKMNFHERTQLLFGILYLGNRIIPVSDLENLIEFKPENEEVTIEKLVSELNGELAARNAPYEVIWRFEKENLELVLKQEYIDKLAFSDYFFKHEAISREKLKIISYITFKNFLEHSPCYAQDFLANKTFDEIKLANILYELEQKDGLIYQVKRGEKVELQLTNQFFDMMNLPKDKFQLGPILRNQLIQVIDGDMPTE